MSVSIPRKSAGARAGEIVFFFALLPALLFFMLIHMGEGHPYILVHEQKLLLTSTAEEYLRQFPDFDISYQLKFAVDYLRDGSIAGWVLNLWPPGMPGLYIAILKLSGPDYFPLKMIALSTLLFSIASYLFYRTLTRGLFSPIALVICVSPLMYASFKISIFLDFNMFSSDFYCFVFLEFLLSLIFGGAWQSIWRLAAAAIVLASLAYFRSFYFIFIKLFTVGSLFTLAAWCVRASANRGWRQTIKGVFQSKEVASVGIVLALTWVLLLPWIVFLKIDGKTFEWTATDQVWAAQWRPDHYPLFVGINTPCVIEKNICEQLMPFQYPDVWSAPKLGSDFYKRLSIATFVSNPFKWYQEKTKLFHYFWFEGHELEQNMPISQQIQYMQSAGLLVACLGLTLASAIRLTRNILHHRPMLEGNGLYILFITFFIHNFLVFTFAHYEARYSVPLKWVTYLFLMFLLKDAMKKIDFRLSGNNEYKGDK